MGALAFAFASPAAVVAQSEAVVENVEADPIRCWWRTSAGAVRVGEPFTLVLTCAVVENESIIVAPDQSRLEPAAVQFPPFEVIGGMRNADLRADQHRFFQYEYQLRVMNEDLFGKDVQIPGVQVSYRIESRLEEADAALRGRELTYTLPTESIRILSLVPSDGGDIRDTPQTTFGEIEAKRFRARVLFVVAGLLFAAGAVMIVVTLVRLARRYRQPAPIGGIGLISDRAILDGVSRELAGVRHAFERGGWTPALIGRALAAFRIAGTMALSRRVSQIAAGPDTAGGLEGQLAIRGGWLRGKKVLASGAATSDAIARELAKASATGSISATRQRLLEQLQTALERFTTAQFGRNTTVDDSALIESLNDGFAIVRRLKLDTLWPVKNARRLTDFATELRSRVWSR